MIAAALKVSVDFLTYSMHFQSPSSDGNPETYNFHNRNVHSRARRACGLIGTFRVLSFADRECQETSMLYG